MDVWPFKPKPETIRPSDRAYYGRRITLGEIEHTRYRFNTLPPRRMHNCSRCGSEVRWFREAPGFDVRNGRPVHTYHLKCPIYGWAGHDWEREHMSESETSSPNHIALMLNYSEMHYDSHLYATVESDRESFANNELP
jgi:hypothetical protein